MKAWNPQLYKKKGQSSDIDSNILRNAIDIGNAIVETNNSIIPIFTLRHLSTLSGIEFKLLHSIVAGRGTGVTPYRFFKMKKRKKLNGKQQYREICVPNPNLLSIQKFICKNILNKIKCHESSVAFSKGSSTYDAALIHCEAKWIIKLDIANFFESINEKNVYELFVNLGFTPLLSFEMARLCTKASTPYKGDPKCINASKHNSKKTYKFYNKTKMGYLPQGAPTSPMISNLVSRKLDVGISKISSEYDLEFTRYADDITLSSTGSFSRTKAKEVISKVYSVFRANGFSPNHTKTTIIPPGARKIVLGLNVECSQPKLPKDLKKRIDQHLHFCLHPDVGVLKHTKEKKFDSIYGFKNHLGGLISYAKQIEPLLGSKMYEKFNKVDWPI